MFQKQYLYIHSALFCLFWAGKARAACHMPEDKSDKSYELRYSFGYKQPLHKLLKVEHCCF